MPAKVGIKSCIFARYVSDVAADTTRLTYHYFVPVLPFLYCLDPKLALMAFS